MKSKCSRDDIPEYKLGLDKSRCLRREGAPERISAATQVGPFISKHYGCQPVEQFIGIGLNPRNEILGVIDCGRGGIDQMHVDPRVLFSGLLLMGASAVIVSHNHPSGDSGPSQQDVNLTTQLRQAAEQLGIRLLDHVIVSRGGEVTSLLQRGMIPG